MKNQSNILQQKLKKINDLEISASKFVEAEMIKKKEVGEKAFKEKLRNDPQIKNAVEKLLETKIDNLEINYEIEILEKEIRIVPKNRESQVAIRLMEYGSGSLKIYANKPLSAFKEAMRKK